MPDRRSLSAFVLAGVVTGLCGTAAAEKDKPKIAVLGLEAASESGGLVDQGTTKVARNLTEGLRNHAASARSVYRLAPSSNRELIDEKLMKSCDSEKPECMAPIGAEVNADFLMYGRVDKTSENGISGYRVSIKLLDVKNKKEQAPWKKFVAAGEATSQWAEDVYATVTNEPKELSTTPVKPPKAKGNSWKTIGYVSAGAAVVLGGTFVYSYKQLADVTSDGKGGPFGTYGDKCPRDPVNTEPAGCSHGGLFSAGTYIGLIGGALAVGLTGVAIYKSSKSDTERRTTASGRERKRNFVVTPVVAPEGAGATVRIDW